VTCSAVLVPAFTRDDVLALDLNVYFKPRPAAVFLLGGDQTVAIQALADTPLEVALADAYAQGTVVAGTSAGAGVQSRAMLAGYTANSAAGSALDAGASDVWHSNQRRGLSFGTPYAIVDQHFFQRGRLGRLLSAIVQPDVPHVGVGVDAYTGLIVRDERMAGEVFGLYTVALLDAETYHAAEAVRYVGDEQTLSLRNVLLHTLAPGAASFDLATRTHSLAAPAPQLARDFAALRLPAGAGPLLLSGDLGKEPGESRLLARFGELRGTAPVTVIAAGFPSERSAQTALTKVAEALGGATTSILLAKDATAPLELPAEQGGIVLLGRDASLIDARLLEPLGEAWRAGVPLLADRAGAAVLGKFYAAHGATPDESEAAELATQKSLLMGRTEIAAGLALLDVTIEAQLLDDNRWGRWLSLAYNQPELLAIGLNAGGGVELDATGARVIGARPVLTLDLRSATRALGDNEGFVIANGLLDVFAPREKLVPQAPNIEAPVRPLPIPRSRLGPMIR
jgi:cyanophycinase